MRHSGKKLVFTVAATTALTFGIGFMYNSNQTVHADVQDNQDGNYYGSVANSAASAASSYANDISVANITYSSAYSAYESNVNSYTNTYSEMNNDEKTPEYVKKLYKNEMNKYTQNYDFMIEYNNNNTGKYNSYAQTQLSSALSYASLANDMNKSLNYRSYCASVADSYAKYFNSSYPNYINGFENYIDFINEYESLAEEISIPKWTPNPNGDYFGSLANTELSYSISYASPAYSVASIVSSLNASYDSTISSYSSNYYKMSRDSNVESYVFNKYKDEFRNYRYSSIGSNKNIFGNPKDELDKNIYYASMSAKEANDRNKTLEERASAASYTAYYTDKVSSIKNDTIAIASFSYKIVDEENKAKVKHYRSVASIINNYSNGDDFNFSTDSSQSNDSNEEDHSESVNSVSISEPVTKNSNNETNDSSNIISNAFSTPTSTSSNSSFASSSSNSYSENNSKQSLTDVIMKSVESYINSSRAAASSGASDEHKYYSKVTSSNGYTIPTSNYTSNYYSSSNITQSSSATESSSSSSTSQTSNTNSNSGSTNSKASVSTNLNDFNAPKAAQHSWSGKSGKTKIKIKISNGYASISNLADPNKSVSKSKFKRSKNGWYKLLSNDGNAISFKLKGDTLYLKYGSKTFRMHK